MWIDKSRFHKLKEVQKHAGDYVLAIDNNTGQPYCAKILSIYTTYDAVGKLIYRYEIEVPVLVVSGKWELIHTGEF